MAQPVLQRVTIFPIKSLDGITLDRVAITNGKLAGDREYAFFDRDDRYVNGKRYPAILRVRARYDNNGVTLSHPAHQSVTAVLPDQSPLLAEWLSEVLQQSIQLRYNPQGFPDDTNASGPTIIGTATIEALADLFQLPPENIRRRFRMNLEIGFAEPLAEDLLVGATKDHPRLFTIGSVQFAGVNICSRCSVPPRDPDTGAILPRFRQRLLQWRKQHTSPAVSAAHIEHFYKLGINTRILAGSELRVGERVRVRGICALKRVLLVYTKAYASSNKYSGGAFLRQPENHLLLGNGLPGR